MWRGSGVCARCVAAIRDFGLCQTAPVGGGALSRPLWRNTIEGHRRCYVQVRA